jgi:hypothetical protein
MMQHAQTGQQYTIMQGATAYPGMQQGFMIVSAHGQQIPGLFTVTIILYHVSDL